MLVLLVLFIIDQSTRFDDLKAIQYIWFRLWIALFNWLTIPNRTASFQESQPSRALYTEMGIPSCRFVDKMNEQFVCTVCCDVAIDPIVVEDCEHIFCRECVEFDSLVKCPTCQEPFKEPKWTRMKGALARCYFGLEIKCLNTSCGRKLDVTTFSDHDQVCNLTFEFCSDCSFKSRRGESNVHSCSKVLKEFYETKLGDVKSDLDQLKELFKKERKRTEDLMTLCTMFRNGFNGSGTRAADADLPRCIKNVKERDTENDWNDSIRKIIAEYDKE